MSYHQCTQRFTVSHTPCITQRSLSLRWGSAEYIGLGFLSFITIVIVEMFGSPFMRNASIIIGLIVGMIVAGATGYVDSSSIDRAPAVTFLWVKRFKLGVYGPAVLPSLAVYVVLAMEAIGDITASADLSRVSVDGVSHCYDPSEFG
jgi:xanthine/uracil permease